jgi:signal transduction histidine kinase
MTTFAADHETERQLRELEDRTRTAWEDYRSSIRQLSGDEYEETELVSWERLQEALHKVADERERVVTTTGSTEDDPAR